MRAARDIELLAALPQPTIAAVNGYALGGGLEMALACDIRLLASTARVGLPEVTKGLEPAGGGTQRLPRLVGYQAAAEMILTGRVIDAAEAVAMGIALQAVEPDELLGVADTLARSIAANDREDVRLVKGLLGRSQQVPASVGAELELDALLGLLGRRG